jgi:gliding motility-associated-like protein
MKKNKTWEEVDNKLFSSLKNKYINIGILNDKIIITADSFNYYENSIQIWSRKGNSKYYLSDSIIIDTTANTQYYYILHKTIFKDWLMFRIYYFDIPPLQFNSYYVNYFYHYKNNKWIKKNNILENNANFDFHESIRCIMKDHFVLFISNRNIYFYKKINENWELFQKEPISNEVLFFPSYSLFNVSISPNEKWSVCGGTYTLNDSNRKNFLNIYKLNSEKWELVQTIEKQVHEDSLFFGSFINISDNELLVGSPGSYKDRGVIYYYKLIDDIWTKKAEIHPPLSDTTCSYFGYSIDRYGETVITGAPKDSTYSYAPGAAYIFQIPARDTVEFTICEGENFEFGDSIISTEGIYTDTLLASYGMDSVVQLYLNILPIDNVLIDTFICENESVTIGDSTWTKPGIYQVVLKNINGCDSIISININVDSIKIMDSVLADYGCDNGVIKLSVQGNNPPFSFIWDNGANEDEIKGLEKGEYTVTISDKSGCTIKKSFAIPDSIPYLIPNAFFPSGQEEINSKFNIYHSKETYILSTEIFNRWGEKVFNGIKNEFWDGTYRGNLQPPGVYLYKVEIESPCGEEVKKGQVMLLK